MREIIINGLGWFALLPATVWGGNIHSEAAQCRLSAALSQTCWNNCVQCHDHTDPIVPLEIYVTGDKELCIKCHPQESRAGSGTKLLRFVGGGGGNHPVSIVYAAEGSRTILVPSPAGPKLFTDATGNNPKIHCSTCHDSMADSINLLRVNNRGSLLCFSCHIK